MRDSQRSKLYQWEEAFVGVRDRTVMTPDQAASMVPVIWKDMGLEFPPRVETLHANTSRCEANATRMRIRVKPEGIRSFVLLHELAHCMTADVNGTSYKHGPVYVGVYLTLLERYMRVDRTEALASLKAAGIKVDPNARPTILD